MDWMFVDVTSALCINLFLLARLRINRIFDGTYVKSDNSDLVGFSPSLCTRLELIGSRSSDRGSTFMAPDPYDFPTSCRFEIVSGCCKIVHSFSIYSSLLDRGYTQRNPVSGTIPASFLIKRALRRPR